MNPLDRKWLRLALASAGAAAVLAIAAGIAAATDTPAGTTVNVTGTATVNSGGLNMVTPGPTFAFADTTLGATTQYSEYASTFEVQDYTGSASGWSLTADATTFTDGTHDLGALETNGGATEGSTTAPSGSCHSGSSSDCTTGASSVGKVTVPAPPATAVVIANQDAGSGMGDIDMPVNWWLTVPPSAHAGSYNSTITLDLASGPNG